MQREGKLMKILAIDTSTTHGSVSLLLDDQEIITRFSTDKENYSTRLFRWLEEVRHEGGLGDDFLSLDAVTVTSGPGTFTGLRVGIATAKSISIASECKLLHFPTLETMAALKADNPMKLCPVVLAGRGEIYSACYKNNCIIDAPRAVKPEELFTLPLLEKTMIYGNGTQMFEPELIERMGSMAEIDDEPIALAPQLCRQALAKLESGSVEIEPLEITYIRSAVS
jgi:tRNA threonylcarbamoyladenosine biosynthesis protein TsaB